jgi:hypothetical protein
MYFGWKTIHGVSSIRPRAFGIWATLPLLAWGFFGVVTLGTTGVLGILVSG